MKKRILVGVILAVTYIIAALFNHFSEVSNLLAEYDWLQNLQKDAIVYILLPLITLILSFYHSKVEDTKKSFGTLFYRMMLDKKIIKLSILDIYIVLIAYAFLSVLTIIQSQIIFNLLFVIISLIVIILVGISFTYVLNSLVRMYLPKLVNDYVEKLKDEKLIIDNSIIFELVENCVINEKVEEINAILESLSNAIDLSLDKYKYSINEHRYFKENINAIFCVLLECIIISSRCENVYSNIAKEKYATKSINTAFRKDCISMHEIMVNEVISRFFFTKSYRTEKIDQLFAVQLVLSTSEYVLRKSISKTWTSSCIKKISELNVVNSVSGIEGNNEVILVSIHHILLEENLYKIASEKDIDLLYRSYFQFVASYTDSSSELTTFFLVTQQILEGLKKKNQDEMIRLFSKAFENFAIETNNRNEVIVRDTCLIITKLQTEFLYIFEENYFEKFLHKLVVDSNKIFLNQEASIYYVDLFLSMLSDKKDLEEYHQTFNSLFVKLSRKDEALCNYVFTFYVKRFIDNIEDSVEFSAYISVISNYLRNGAREFEDTLFYTSLNYFYDEYKDYVQDHPRTNHEYKRVIGMTKDILIESIDVNNNDRYLYTIKRIKSLISDTVKYRKKETVYYIFLVLNLVAKYSLERHYIDIVKSSSNELSWYIKENFAESYTEYLSESIKALVHLFNLSIHIDSTNNIIPSFIGTAFILLGSIGFEAKDKPSRNARIINSQLKEIYSEEVYDIIQISYNLRLTGNSVVGSEFDDESITNYFENFKKHVAKK